MAKRDIIFNNFWWKATALLLAVVVWITFHSGEYSKFRLPEGAGGTSFTRTLMSHPVTVQTSATDPRDFKVTPSVVDIVLSGDPAQLKTCETNVQAVVDLRNLKTNRSEVKIRVELPPKTRLERIFPEVAHVELAKP